MLHLLGLCCCVTYTHSAGLSAAVAPSALLLHHVLLSLVNAQCCRTHISKPCLPSQCINVELLTKLLAMRPCVARVCLCVQCS